MPQECFGQTTNLNTFCVQNYPKLTTVTYEMAAKWSEARPGEGDAYHNRRMSMVKVLSEYILSLVRKHTFLIFSARLTVRFFTFHQKISSILKIQNLLPVYYASNCITYSSTSGYVLDRIYPYNSLHKAV